MVLGEVPWARIRASSAAIHCSNESYLSFDEMREEDDAGDLRLLLFSKSQKMSAFGVSCSSLHACDDDVSGICERKDKTMENLGNSLNGTHLNPNIHGGEKHEADDDVLSKFEHSDAEDSMFSYGNDDDGVEFHGRKSYNVLNERNHENVNPLVMNSSVVFGCNDWDEFEQETAGGCLDSFSVNLDNFVWQKDKHIQTLLEKEVADISEAHCERQLWPLKEVGDLNHILATSIEEKVIDPPAQNFREDYDDLPTKYSEYFNGDDRTIESLHSKQDTGMDAYESSEKHLQGSSVQSAEEKNPGSVHLAEVAYIENEVSEIDRKMGRRANHGGKTLLKPALPMMAENISNLILEHITQQCLVCYDSGIPCSARQACHDPSSLIFPFQEAEAEKCSSCGSIFHKDCYVNLLGCPCRTPDAIAGGVGPPEQGRQRPQRELIAFPESHTQPSQPLASNPATGGFFSGIFSKARADKIWKPKNSNPIADSLHQSFGRTEAIFLCIRTGYQIALSTVDAMRSNLTTKFTSERYVPNKNAPPPTRHSHFTNPPTSCRAILKAPHSVWSITRWMFGLPMVLIYLHVYFKIPTSGIYYGIQNLSFS
ncbi:hypothetical protein HPP92_009496 [Vanilla planifolia]|uniref:Rubicon Homology domain-containing protein n=1 Tax=Vanilla planifolia TaxID=51239 RepID=A0A835R7X3_VANPL|nr:hypothetical protein HPP92_009496 [Vanilla planifolia]